MNVVPTKLLPDLIIFYVSVKVEKCDPQPVMPHGSLVGGTGSDSGAAISNKIGKILTAHCAHGYELRGRVVVVCLPGGAWSPVPSCVNMLTTTSSTTDTTSTIRTTTVSTTNALTPTAPVTTPSTTTVITASSPKSPSTTTTLSSKTVKTSPTTLLKTKKLVFSTTPATTSGPIVVTDKSAGHSQHQDHAGSGPNKSVIAISCILGLILIAVAIIGGLKYRKYRQVV